MYRTPGIVEVMELVGGRSEFLIHAAWLQGALCSSELSTTSLLMEEK